MDQISAEILQALQKIAQQQETIIEKLSRNDNRIGQGAVEASIPTAATSFSSFEGVILDPKQHRKSNQTSFVNVPLALKNGIKEYNSSLDDGAPRLETNEFEGSLLAWSNAAMASVRTILGKYRDLNDGLGSMSLDSLRRQPRYVNRPGKFNRDKSAVIRDIKKTIPVILIAKGDWAARELLRNTFQNEHAASKRRQKGQKSGSRQQNGVEGQLSAARPSNPGKVVERPELSDTENIPEDDSVKGSRPERTKRNRFERDRDHTGPYSAEMFASSEKFDDDDASDSAESDSIPPPRKSRKQKTVPSTRSRKRDSISKAMKDPLPDTRTAKKAKKPGKQSALRNSCGKPRYEKKQSKFRAPRRGPRNNRFDGREDYEDEDIHERQRDMESDEELDEDSE